MTRQRRNARRRIWLEAQGKRCNGSVYYDGRLEPCLITATLKHDGKKYCRLHYPPNKIEREPSGFRRATRAEYIAHMRSVNAHESDRIATEQANERHIKSQRQDQT